MARPEAPYREACMSLKMRPACERCGKSLAADAPAFVCSYECTFCPDCAVTALSLSCPNCGGELVPRPKRSPAPPPSPVALKRAVGRFYELMNARRFDEMWALFAPDATWTSGGENPRFASGIDVMRGVIVDPMPIFVTGGISFTLRDMTAEGDRVAAEVESYAELVNGGVYNNRYHMLFRFRGEEIVEVREYGDTLHAKEVFVDSGLMGARDIGLAAPEEPPGRRRDG